MWPLSLPVGDSGRARLTFEAAGRAPRLLRRNVSRPRSAENRSPARPVAVRHTPFTAILAPSMRSSITFEQRTVRRALAVSTVPSSSMIPVNIEVSFDGKFVGRDGMDGNASDHDGILTAAPADTARQRQRLESAEDLRTVIEEHTVDAIRFECGPVQLAARFDHQREVALATQPVD